MVYEQRRLTRPLSRIELVISILLIGMFIGIFIQKILVLTAVAEATALELMLRNLRTGVMTRVAELLVEGNYAGIADLAESNPMSVLETPVRVYKGKLREGIGRKIEPGVWYYDEDQNILVYDVINDDYFSTEGEVPGRIRIRFRLNFEDRNNNGNYDDGIDRPQGVSVVIVDRYEWIF
jgi:hypothetical protein